MTSFSPVSFYNDKNYIKMFSQNTKCDLFYDSVPLVPLEHILHLVLVILKLTLNKQMVVGLITCWKLEALKLALLFRHFLVFVTRLMV